jgi:hypothetical protein
MQVIPFFFIYVAQLSQAALGRIMKGEDVSIKVVSGIDSSSPLQRLFDPYEISLNGKVQS